MGNWWVIYSFERYLTFDVDPLASWQSRADISYLMSKYLWFDEIFVCTIGVPSSALMMAGQQRNAATGPPLIWHRKVNEYNNYTKITPTCQPWFILLSTPQSILTFMIYLNYKINNLICPRTTPISLQHLSSDLLLLFTKKFQFMYHLTWPESVATQIGNSNTHIIVKTFIHLVNSTYNK